MNPNERARAIQHIPTLQATAALLLPGLKHARSLLDVSIRVLQYFESQALKDANSGKATQPPAADRTLIDEAENVKALMTAFGRLHS
jgi:hypothetical protein